MENTVDIQKLQAGDPFAFRSFFERFYPKMMALACRFVDEQVAEDLVQDVFASYWEQKAEIEAAQIQSFLFKWLQNSCLNYLKHETVVREHESRIRIAEARIAFLEDTTDASDVLKQLINNDLLQIIELSILKLSPKCERAFRLRYFHDMSYKEIGSAMAISPRTVEGHVQQAIRFLRTDLKDFLTLAFMFYSMA